MTWKPLWKVGAKRLCSWSVGNDAKLGYPTTPATREGQQSLTESSCGSWRPERWKYAEKSPLQSPMKAELTEFMACVRSDLKTYKRHWLCAVRTTHGYEEQHLRHSVRRTSEKQKNAEHHDNQSWASWRYTASPTLPLLAQGWTR